MISPPDASERRCRAAVVRQRDVAADAAVVFRAPIFCRAYWPAMLLMLRRCCYAAVAA